MWSRLLPLAVLLAGCGAVPSLDDARALVAGPDEPEAVLPDSLDANLAVLAFENNTGDPRYDPFGRGLAHMMTTDLSTVPTLQLVERDQLQLLVDELDLQQTEYFDEETALQVGRFVGAEHVIVGSIAAVDPEIRLDTRVVAVETAEVVQAESVTGREDALFSLQQELAATLIAGIDVVLSDEARAALAAQQEANRIDDLDTALAFSEALVYYDQEDYARALEKLYEVKRQAPASQMVDVAIDLAGDRARDRSRDALRGRVNRMLGGQ